MEETEDSKSSKTCSSEPWSCRGRTQPHQRRHPLPLLPHSFHNVFGYHDHRFQKSPALLPLPPPIHLQLPVISPPIQTQKFRSKTHMQHTAWKQKKPTRTSSADTQVSASTVSQAVEEGLQQKQSMPTRGEDKRGETAQQALVAPKRPDSGGIEGSLIPLLANHFLVQFDSSQKIFHYDVEISPQPSKEVARMIKQKFVQDHSAAFSNVQTAFDGRKNLYSPVEFQNDKLEFYISLPIPMAKSIWPSQGTSDRTENHHELKLFRVNIRLVSKLDGRELSCYLNKEGDDWAPLPQEYLHSLDIVLRQGPIEKCIPVGRSLYSSSMGGSKDIGGGAVGLRGFFQSLRPTQQGLALNVDFSVTAFHESIGIIQYLQKRLESLKDLSQRKTRGLVGEEKKDVEKALKNIRVFVCHRETNQRYRVHSLTNEATENLWFKDRGGKDLRLVDYFKDYYNLDIQFRNLPCLQISRSKPCYLPMELCVVCEGQKYLGKLSDDQTARILKMGCQRPKERKAIIDGVMGGTFGPTSEHGREFKLHVSREMTRLNGRVLQPPKLKLGDSGNVTNLVPSRHDRQWNLLDSHVFEGTRIERWALISFGGTPDQRSNIPRFIDQLSQRCEQLGIFLNKNTLIRPQFEPIQVLNNVALLESKLKKIHRASSRNLQLLICVMERKHKGYADLKRIAETGVGVVTQCCLYPNLAKLGSQFLANLALKINAKIGGCTVALYNSLPSQVPRLFEDDDPAIFMGADVTHPHPLDDSSPSIAAVVGTMNWPAANKYISRMRSQTHRQEIIEDLGDMVAELLEDFYQEVNNKLPKRIIFFRDGVSETQFYKVLQEELKAIRVACSRFPSYKPSITFMVVQKRHHTRLFPYKSDPSLTGGNVLDENIPPGTVVDTIVTHPREFDFYLCSHWGVKGTSRPTHYHVLWDENKFTSDELQKLVHNLCYTFVRCTKPVSLVPPAYYAHLAAYRGRLYLERSDLPLFARTTAALSRSAPPKATPLPKLNDNLRKLMFYC
ncbi:protein argonaute 7 isoform X3 [Macadamia integrifolia]|uniref:protein argonaute 7 isoform X3 n=1 Tax=Macadamia integrifolia TaxID=60698 RepID=UPI001C4E5151|nr:protein argonaute 7 isoform X3 [Macadamia integrifolia]